VVVGWGHGVLRALGQTSLLGMSIVAHFPLQTYAEFATVEKNALKPWQKEAWCIPRMSAAFVWRMEDSLELYAEPYSHYQLVCFDESPYQSVSDVRQPLPVAPG